MGCGKKEQPTNTKESNNAPVKTAKKKAGKETPSKGDDKNSTAPEPSKNLAENLKGKRIYISNGKSPEVIAWMEFHTDQNVFTGRGDKILYGLFDSINSISTTKWSVNGSQIKTQLKSDDDYIVFKDPTLKAGSAGFGYNGLDALAKGKGERFLIKQIETRSSSELAAIPAGFNLIKSFVNAMAVNNEEALMNLTCLGLTEEQFKAFMAKNNGSKVKRLWDVTNDDFVPEINAHFREAFQKILKEAREKGIDWRKIYIREWELTDDVKAELGVSGSRVKLNLHLDDCFLTTRGMLMFDVPRAR